MSEPVPGSGPHLSRRSVTGVLAGAGLGAIVSSVPLSAHAAPSDRSSDSAGRFDRPGEGFSSVRRLKAGRASEVGLDAADLEQGWQSVMAHTEALPGEDHARFPGAVLLYAHQGRIVLHRGDGWAKRYADAESELDRGDWLETRTDTIHDMASVSKLFTSIVVMQQVEAGRIDLNRTVASYIPQFAEGGKEEVTVRMLLTHTSGFPSWIPLHSKYPDIESRIEAALVEPVQNDPGSTYLYSDLNLICLAVLAERQSGKGLAELVADGITTPLGMVDTGYNPPEEKWDRVAATEYQADPDRGLVWGQVHDENAWSLGGVAGHAGIFSTAKDMAALAQAILNGGWYGTERILSEESVTAMITNENTDFPGDDHGLGFEINQRWYMGGFASPRTVGHTGFTGTSLVIDHPSNSFVVLLTNRVHPSRDWGSVNPARLAAANGLADALRIAALEGKSYWQASEEPETESTLTLELPDEASEVRFGLFLDVESSDPFALETSVDDGETWQFCPYTLDNEQISEPIGRSGLRAWQRARATLPEAKKSPRQIRWAQERDKLYEGRGLLVDAIHVRDDSRVILDVEADPSLLDADGWTLTDA